MTIFHSYATNYQRVSRMMKRPQILWEDSWLLVYLYRKRLEFVSWDDDIPN